MSEKYKKILKFWLLLYFLLTIFSIYNVFNGSILDDIGTFSLHISNLILFVYVSNRGEEKIGMFGIISIVIYFFVSLLNKYSVYDLGIYYSTSLKDKFFSTIYYTSSNCITVCDYLAIFSLINNDKVQKYKSIAIWSIVGFLVINLVRNIFSLYDNNLLDNIYSCLNYISSLARYSVIILYLTDSQYAYKKSNLELSNVEQPIQSVNVNQQIQSFVPVQPTNVGQQVQPTNVGQQVQPTNVGQQVQPTNVGQQVQPTIVGQQVQPNNVNYSENSVIPIQHN